MNDLDTLRPEVREALERMIVLCSAANKTGKWMRADCDTVIIAELLRLAGDLNAARLSSETFEAKYRCMRERAEKAEAEFAALKARILPGAAKVEIADTDDPDGNPYGWVGGTLLSHDLIGKRVRLVVED